MNAISTAAVAAPAQLAARPAAAVLAAAQLLRPMLERGARVNAPALRAAMETAFGASDTSGAWDWKLAYEACEAATVLFLRKYGPALQSRAGSMPDMLPFLTRIVGLLPSQTRRSEEMQVRQQFSTPIPLGLAAVTAAAITPGDVVLEPSAGTGLMAILAEIAGGQLMLNELAETRAELLAALFPAFPVSRFDAAQIHDHLPVDLVPSVVLMNPPFSAMANVQGRVPNHLTGMTSAVGAHISPACGPNSPVSREPSPWPAPSNGERCPARVGRGPWCRSSGAGRQDVWPGRGGFAGLFPSGSGGQLPWRPRVSPPALARSCAAHEASVNG